VCLSKTQVLASGATEISTVTKSGREFIRSTEFINGIDPEPSLAPD
jgi:hypothetical protein